MTGFNWGDSLGDFDAWRSVDEIFRGSYNELTRLGKPIMVSEIGTVPGGGDPARWIRRAMSRFESAYPRIKAVVWFDSPYPGEPEFRLDRTASEALRGAFGASEHWGRPLRLEAAPATS
jgi:hypothetical protein